jgi:hypothetical protein
MENFNWDWSDLHRQHSTQFLVRQLSHHLGRPSSVRWSLGLIWDDLPRQWEHPLQNCTNVLPAMNTSTNCESAIPSRRTTPLSTSRPSPGVKICGFKSQEWLRVIVDGDELYRNFNTPIWLRQQSICLAIINLQ